MHLCISSPTMWSDIFYVLHFFYSFIFRRPSKRFDPHPTSNLDQFAKLLCAQAISASYKVKCWLWGECLEWLIRAVLCLRCGFQMSVTAVNVWLHIELRLVPTDQLLPVRDCKALLLTGLIDLCRQLCSKCPEPDC